MRRVFRTWKARWNSRRFVAKLRRRGVTCQDGVRFLGHGAIRIGSGSDIGFNSVLAATDLGPHDCGASQPHGSIDIGRNVKIRPNAMVASYGGGIELADNVIIGPMSVLYGHGGLRIGRNTLIAGQCMIVPANHVFNDPDRPIREQGETRKGISIGADVWIAAGVAIVDGVTIGDGAVVGAGAVVTADVPPCTVVAGIPARRLGDRS